MVCCSYRAPVDVNEVLAKTVVDDQKPSTKKHAEPKHSYVLGRPTQFDPTTYNA